MYLKLKQHDDRHVSHKDFLFIAVKKERHFFTVVRCLVSFDVVFATLNVFQSF